MSFGTSGMLYHSNKLMYDRGTKSWWHQFLGEPVVDHLADSGTKLDLFPVTLTTWIDWLAIYPDTTVLDIKTGVYPITSYSPEDDRQSIYFRYRNTPVTIFPVPERADVLETHSQVLGLTLNGKSIAYPLELLSRRLVVNDTLGGQDLVVVATDQGIGARAYQRKTHEFSLLLTGPEDGSLILTDLNDRRWRVEEDALVLLEHPRQRLLRLPSRASYWFGWYRFPSRYSDLCWLG